MIFRMCFLNDSKNLNKTLCCTKSPENLTVAGIMLAAVVLIIDQNWFLSVGTGDILKWRTFIWNNFDRVVFNAFSHGAVAQYKCLILLMIRKKKTLNKMRKACFM